MIPAVPSAETLLAEAVALPDPAARERYLDRACAADAPLRAEIRRLLRAHFRAGGFLEHPPILPDAAATVAFQTAPEDLPPDTILGPYRLREKIGEGVDALGQELFLRVGDAVGIAGVEERGVEGVAQADLLIGFAQEQQPGVGGDGARREFGDEFAAMDTGKRHGGCGTVCHAAVEWCGVEGSVVTPSPTKPSTAALLPL